MSTESANLAAQFETVNEALIALVRDLPPERWTAQCADEQWPVCAVTNHIAVSERVIASWIRRVAQGTPVTITRAAIDQGNDRDASAHLECDRDATVALLRQHGQIARDTIAALSDEELAMRAEFGPAHGRELSAREVVEKVLFRHVQGHMASIRATLAAPA